MDNKLIYIADDDDNIRNLIKTFLEREGFNVIGFPTGDLLYERFKDTPCDMVILDVMMPGHDGIFILKEIRKTYSNLPIIMLTARDSDKDYILGLDSGSDDYLTKPFSPVKLVSRVKNIMKRHDEVIGATFDKSPDDYYMFADIKINKKTKQATLKDEPLQLTPNEYQLITYLIDNRNRAVPRAELLDKIWGYEFEVETRVADDTVKRLRKKIKDSDAEIKTVWSYGFRIVDKKEDKN
ncbi:MAG: response regulator transcription factor [Clostridiales bacterium]|nr:response regulator transcription factor [Clostridiales bacterium]